MRGWMALVSWWCSVASAQDAPPVSLSLEDALRLGQNDAEAVLVAEAAVSRAQGDRWRSVSGFLPSLNLSASYSHTFASEFSRLFAPPETTPGTPTPGTGGTGTTSGTTSGLDLGALPFGQANAYRIDFALVQPVFGGGRAIAQNKLATASREVADVGVASARAGVALDIARAYYDAALADRLSEIAADVLAQAEATASDARLANEVGRIAEFDLLRATVEVENQRVNVVRQARLQQTAHLRLRQLLDLPADAVLDLTSRIDASSDGEPRSIADAAAASAGVSADATADRAPVQLAEIGIRASRSSLAIARSQWFPSVNASAAYGWTSYPDGVVPDFDPDAWYRNVTAGFAIAVPLFNGGRVRGDVMRASADVTEARARMEQARELTELDTRDALLELSSAEAQWNATRGTVEQAERAYRIAELRYREGVSTQLELADSRLLLQRALANRAQAARDLQVARIREALLPVLPVQLGAGSGSSATASPTNF